MSLMGRQATYNLPTGRVRLQIFNGAAATAWFPEIMMALAATPGHQLLLDGEVCVVDELGRCDFERLKRRAQLRATSPARTWSGRVAYCAFDIFVADGRSVMDEQLVTCKERLAEVFAQRPNQLRS
jgi:bifunctional non-homologous end joining protein LigD